MRRFWNWEPDGSTTDDPAGDPGRVLRINGAIAEESWFDDDITPGIFANELNAGSGPVTIWLNSPGGDVVAAAQIYNMLIDYPGTVTVNIDGIAASAASVIAMAASTVAMSSVSMLMIHNPATMAVGDKDELARAMSMLDSVKESIVNAYQLKTGMSRAKLSKLMDQETWMDARAAIDMGFADQLLTGSRDPIFNADKKPDEDEDEPESDEPDDKPDEDGEDDGKPAKKGPPFPPKKNRTGGVVFARRTSEQQLVAACTHHQPDAPPGTPVLPAGSRGRRVVDLYAQLTNRAH
ncbi:head maturation protease, ClpP-related [Corynebacterium silvaticum]|uniref:ATP-dependent Clp protease proteolytic subunit n=1 Tax=Corynebacterium silvaticum TaxID=2320431 RepID=A0A7Y4LK96_9CORY|nr:head maturation protease, ClpP-related [Corynebacterium silvaticum]ARU45733.1 Clp protease ClpP [Corynebacterium silvaticum]NON70302.1 Clp protease ClpP [Corynebacterium silvaticum]UWH00848.1 Clp protease ClpP [Corynebacterium silvaticum]UWH02896.1 Clp protease ClpP [Corynebacterium silvaticum]UWH04935.1 Clp protease ClpP [Corynebacterium silvaticum]